MERLLERQPELQGAVSLIQIVTSSRMGLAYRQKKREIDEIVGRINGRISDGFWMPVRYLYRSVSPAELIAYCRAADIALVTPFRDGLNLVAKEYVAARVDGEGTLILCEFAAVARQLPEALLVNPYNIAEMVTALSPAMQMPPADQQLRMGAMQERVQAQDISWWAKEFLGHMTALNTTVPAWAFPKSVGRPANLTPAPSLTRVGFRRAPHDCSRKIAGQSEKPTLARPGGG